MRARARIVGSGLKGVFLFAFTTTPIHQGGMRRLEKPAQPRPCASPVERGHVRDQLRSSDCAQFGGVLSVMYITDHGRECIFSDVCLGKVKCDARPDQLIAFTRCLYEALPIKYRDLLSAALNQAGMLQLSRNIRDGWPLHTQHFREQILSDGERVIVAAVTHHEEPTR
jgi:hypothetical protein